VKTFSGSVVRRSLTYLASDRQTTFKASDMEFC